MSKFKYLCIVPVNKEKYQTEEQIVNGMPSIYWTIKYARESKRITKLLVVTNSNNVAKIVKSYGVDVLETTKRGKLIDFAINEVESKNVVVLSPKVLIRYHEIIDECIRIFEEENADVLISGEKRKKRDSFTQKKSYKPWFYASGCVEVYKTEFLFNGKKDANKIQYKVPKEFNLEVQDAFDIASLDIIMKKLGISL